MNRQSEFHAYRDIEKCTKDCICLYICPTGATDTENGQVDFDKCIGCGACINACPSRALLLLPRIYPEQQPKKEPVLNVVRSLAQSKVEQEKIMDNIVKNANTDAELILAKAISKSNRIMAEDLMREGGFLLPQSNKVREFLEDISKTNDEFSVQIAKKLKNLLKTSNDEMKK